jgi:hypothetical protein
VDANKGFIELLHHLAERSRQCGPPADQHVIVAGAQMRPCAGRREPDDFAQPAADPIPLHGVADLPRHCEADPDGAIFATLPRLKHKGAARGACALGRGPKIAAAPQPLDDGRIAILLTH